jgi:hypothetical protein
MAYGHHAIPEDRPRARARGRAAAVAVSALVLALAASAGGEVIDRVLATVAGESITLSDVRAEQALGLIGGADADDPVQDGLRRLIDRTLVLTEVRRFAPPEPDGKDIDARVQDMRRRFDAPAEMARAMAEWGVTDARLRVLARDDLLIRSYLSERFAVADLPAPEQIEEYMRAEEDAARLGQAPGVGSEVPPALERRAGSVLVGWMADLRQRVEITTTVPLPSH